MSHEIRTPMNAIIGFSNLLNDPLLTEKNRKQYCEIIKTSSDNLLNIISDILEISKIESGNISLKLEDININQFLIKLQKEYLLKNNNKLIDIKCMIDCSFNKIISNTDDNRLKQVMVNLINNALKFTKQGVVEFGYTLESEELRGKTWQSLQTSESKEANEDMLYFKDMACLQFYVKDTGIGIAEENKEMIFERFKQVEYTNTRSYGGNGLGLAISKKIVEAMGGRIWFESQLGKGSTFYFTLPIKQAKSEERQRRVKSKSEGRRFNPQFK